VMLSQAIERVRSNGYFVTGDTTDRKVTVPKHFSDDLTTAECQELLHKEGIKYAEFANH
jgi:prophage antirepressor-like protein